VFMRNSVPTAILPYRLGNTSSFTLVSEGCQLDFRERPHIPRSGKDYAASQGGTQHLSASRPWTTVVTTSRLSEVRSVADMRAAVPAV
jgi:hypothetical protein